MSNPMAGWTDRMNRDHAAEVANGKHDELCEWRDAGHFLCNCAPRRRAAKGITKPPELRAMYPVCQGCHSEASHDGECYVCYACNAIWPQGPELPGEFSDDHGTLDTSRWDGPAVSGEQAQPDGETQR